MSKKNKDPQAISARLLRALAAAVGALDTQAHGNGRGGDPLAHWLGTTPAPKYGTTFTGEVHIPTLDGEVLTVPIDVDEDGLHYAVVTDATAA